MRVAVWALFGAASFGAILAGNLASPAIAQVAPVQGDAAAQFGALEGVEDISLSPDGRSVAFIVPGKGRGNALYTVSTSGGATPKRVLAASGAPERLRYCGWVSDDRLLCNVHILRADVFSPVAMSRLIAVDADGGNVKVVSRRDSPDAIGRNYFGGAVLDWLPGQDGAVLLGRSYVPEERIGSNVSGRHEGYGVDRVDTRTLKFKRIEQPRPGVVEYITDGTGNVRIMGAAEVSGTGYATGRTKYFYRQPGSRPGSRSANIMS